MSASQGLGAEAGLLGQRALGFQPGDTEGGVLDCVQRTDIKSLLPRGDASPAAAVNVNVFPTLIGISPRSLTMATYSTYTDPETGVQKTVDPEVKGLDSPLTHSPSHVNGEYYESERPSLATRMGVTPSSFKQRTLADKHNQLNKTMKSRHLNMIAIGGSIGAGLFVGSGGALAKGGPAALLICFSLIGIVSIERISSILEATTDNTADDDQRRLRPR